MPFPCARVACATLLTLCFSPSRLTSNSFVPVSFHSRLTELNPADTPQTSTTLAPDFKAVTVRTKDDSIVNVELWDFPGVVTGDRPGPLLSTFFHAAIICLSLEDEETVYSLAEVRF